MLIELQAGGDITGTVIWFLMFFVLIFLYPRLMLSQMLYSLEKSASEIERMSKQANHMVARKINKKPSKELMKNINGFTDFFVVEPSSLDPYGIVAKIDQTIRQMEARFKMFVGEITNEEQEQVDYGLRAAMSLRQIAKIVRHYVEMAKKFRNLQIAMILQMQLPIIKKIAKSELKGTESFINTWPIGDSIGPLCATSLIDSSKGIAENIVLGRTKIEGRNVFVLKATGPAPSLGREDEAIEKLFKKHKFERIITIDAGLKLEGELTGSVAEGVGFAMGGIGQRDIIENMLLPKKKPIDGIVIKVGIEEAITPMRKAIHDAVPHVHKLVKKSVLRAKKGSNVLLIGVGNSCGIPDSKKGLDKVKNLVEKLEKKAKEAEKKAKKGSWF